MNVGILAPPTQWAPPSRALLGDPRPVPTVDPLLSFDPTTIGTMVAWYDFSDTSTLTLVNGLISAIANKSGTAPTLSQSTEANRPSLSFLGGRQAGLFDGSNDVLFNNTATQGYGTLLAAVGNPQNASATSSVAASFAYNNGAVVEAFAVGIGSVGDPGGSGRWSAAGGVNTGIGVRASGFVSTKPLGSGGGFIIAMTFNRTSAPVARVNGRTEPYGGPNIQGNQSHAALGARNINLAYSLYWYSTIGEVLHYPAILSAYDIDKVSKYLSVKWGISG